MSLAPLIQTSHLTDPKAPNHNQFAALATPVQKLTDSKKSKWVSLPNLTTKFEKKRKFERKGRGLTSRRN